MSGAGSGDASRRIQRRLAQGDETGMLHRLLQQSRLWGLADADCVDGSDADDLFVDRICRLPGADDRESVDPADIGLRAGEHV